MITEDFSEPEKYDSWYDKYKNIYKKELGFVKKLLENDNFVEIGAGTGRFGGELGALCLIELSEKMIKFSLQKGYDYIKADAHNLPLRRESIGTVLFAFSLSFVKDPLKALKEAFDVAKNKVVIVDINTELSKKYVENLKSSYKSYNPSFIYSVNRFDKIIRIERLSIFIKSEKIVIDGIVIHKRKNCE